MRILAKANGTGRIDLSRKCYPVPPLISTPVRALLRQLGPPLPPAPKLRARRVKAPAQEAIEPAPGQKQFRRGSTPRDKSLGRAARPKGRAARRRQPLGGAASAAVPAGCRIRQPAARH